MLLLQPRPKDNPTEKKVMGWQNGPTMCVLLQVYGDKFEGITGARKNMKNYYHDYQFHAKPTISSGEVDNGEKL